jgi:hypothetical protein
VGKDKQAAVALLELEAVEIVLVDMVKALEVDKQVVDIEVDIQAVGNTEVGTQAVVVAVVVVGCRIYVHTNLH